MALTAGHCFNDSQTLWSTADRAGNRLFYGTALRRTYGEDGDTGILELSPTLAADAQNWVFVIDSDTDAGPFTTRNPHYRIRGSATSKVGNYVCFSGYASGSRCGKIRKVNQTFKDKDDNVLIKHVADAAVCSTSGDSGGPVYKGGLAFGTVVGRRRNRLHQCVGMAYMGAKRAELLNGVTISG